MKQIGLSLDPEPEFYAVVDDGDYAELAKHNWTPLRINGKVVAVRHEAGQLIYMHRQIMAREIAEAGAAMYVRHKDRDGLNNRRDNLALASRQDLPRMGHKHSARHGEAPSSPYHNVSRDRRTDRWTVNMRMGGAFKHFGRFSGDAEGEILAAIRADEVASERAGAPVTRNLEIALERDGEAVARRFPGWAHYEQQRAAAAAPGRNGRRTARLRKDKDGNLLGFVTELIDEPQPGRVARDAGR